MANLKEIRNRITSVTSTKQITSAMKMVSAAKLKRAQDAITQMKPYAAKLKELLENLSDSTDGEQDSPYAVKRDVENVLIVAINSNRGLAGAFNANVIKATNKFINERYADKKVTVLAIGKKADDFFKKTEYNIKGTTLPNNLNLVYDDLSFENVSKIAESVMQSFRYKQFDKVYMIYNEFVNAATQNIVKEQFLPIEPAEDETKNKKKTNTDFIFEPNKEFIITELIPKSLRIQFYKALLDSFAAEHGARMTAMHQATDNAATLIHDLKLVYNKARQAAITNEILEIVGGADALDG